MEYEKENEKLLIQYNRSVNHTTDPVLRRRLCHPAGPPATVPTATESANVAERCGSEAQSAGEDAQGESSGPGPHVQEVAGRCLDRRFRHLQRAGPSAPGWNHCQSVYSNSVPA